MPKKLFVLFPWLPQEKDIFFSQSSIKNKIQNFHCEVCLDTGTGLNLSEPREVADVPTLVPATALSNLVKWEMSLHMALRLGLVDL